jgi:transposase
MKFEREARVYLAVGVTDLRKAINGLSVLAKEQLGQDPFAGSYFAFSNRGRNRIKVLYWDRNGFCLWQKSWRKREKMLDGRHCTMLSNHS